MVLKTAPALLNEEQNRKRILGLRIQMARKEMGFKQEELGLKLAAITGKKKGITKFTIGRWETGKIMPDIETLYQLCAILGKNIDYFLDYKKETENRSLKEIENKLEKIMEDNIMYQNKIKVLEKKLKHGQR